MNDSPQHASAINRGRVLVALAAILWSLSGVVVKSEALASLDSLTIAFYRSLFSGLALLPFVPTRRWEFSGPLLGMAMVFGLAVGAYMMALRATTAANVIFLVCSSTVWAAGLSVILLKEKPDLRSTLGIACALPGVLFIIAFGHAGTPKDWFGVSLGVASGFGYALVTVTMRSLRHCLPAWLVAANNLGGAVVLALWLLIAQGHIPIPTATQALMLAVFGVVQLAIPYVLFAYGLRTVSAAEAGLIILIEPILNPLWVLLVQDERPRIASIVGGMFLLLGVGVRYIPWGRRLASSPLPTSYEESQD